MNKYNISLHSAVDKTLDLIRMHYENCVAIEERLPWSKSDEKLNRAIRETVKECHMMAAGTAYWRQV